MLKWFHRLIWLFPSRAASASAIIILVVAGLFFAWLSMQPQFAFGRVTVVELTQDGRKIAELNPWFSDLPMVNNINKGRPDLVVFNQQSSQDTSLLKGSWLLAYGLERISAYRILNVHRFAILPVGTLLLTMEPLLHMLRGLSLPALIVGGFLIVAGRQVMRLLAALVLALAAAALIWHATLAAEFTGAVEMPKGALYPLAMIGLAFGAATALRARQDMLQMGLERMLAMLLLIYWLPAIATYFTWPEESVGILAVMLTLLTPLVAYSLLGAFWLAVGLAASTQAGYAILGLSTLIVIVLQADTHNMYPDRIMNKLAPHRDPRSGRIPLRTIF